ncbi:MAG: SCO family protein [Sphingobacteriales bacterium]|nr:SCO family protein [Sphingobacteriales bacterium]
MGKKGLLGLALAGLVPLTAFFIFKYFGDQVQIMPRHYYMDSLRTHTEDGKIITDTVWRKVGNISLHNQLGDSVSLDSLKGKVIVANFFFTRCPSICPRLTANMHKLQESFMKTQGYVQFLSFSVDPERDSVPVLKRYATKYNINHSNWWLLTGEKKTIYDFALNEVKLGLQDGEGVDSNFIHTPKFVLIDRNRVIRGYYNGLDSTEMLRLLDDVVFLNMETEKKKPKKKWF